MMSAPALAGKPAGAGPAVVVAKTMDGDVAALLRRIERLNAIGVALSRERQPQRVLEIILVGAKELTNADAGTIYSVQGDEVRFEIVRNDTLRMVMGGTIGLPVRLPSIQLRNSDGTSNRSSVVARAVTDRTTLNIPDAYAAGDGLDFSGTRAFDERSGYRSRSFLTVPMTDHEGVVTGVLQLINARTTDGETVAFGESEQRLAESLASQAATAAAMHRLIDEQRQLFESFIKLIATAIDEKSPYTGGHCKRVPELTMALADAAALTTEGPLAGFRMNDADRYELHIAGWVHDCGKITTPEWVMDKATKLERICDRIELVAARFAAAMAAERTAGHDTTALADDLVFLRRCNQGGEAMRPDDQDRVRSIATRRWIDADGRDQPLLTEDEVRNLTINKGTLLPEERQIINNHMVATIKMLEALPFPRHLRRVPEFAGGHHERMDGKGYPKGLRGDQMSVQARCMAIADVFEALTAADRPYKQAMPLSQALKILANMARTGHIDPDLFAVFIREGVWKTYADRFLKDDQRDVPDLAAAAVIAGV
jgi:HD-GYP domain-containing protein (c-di-GMP phosphodiesterase class II)